LTKDAARYKAKEARNKVLASDKFSLTKLRRYAIRPFDTRWCYYSEIRPLWNEPRPALWSQFQDGNSFLMSRPARVSSPEGVPISFTVCLGDNDYLRGHAYYIPMKIRNAFNHNKKPKEQAHLIQPEEETRATANLSTSARGYLASLGINPDSDIHTASLIWMHALAIGYSPAYLSENADGIRKDWPRIPLPDKKEILETSATLGEKIAALLDTEKPVPGVTASPIRQEIQNIAVITREGGGELHLPKELAVTVGWGHTGQNGVVMPGKGKLVERDYTAEEKQLIVSGAEQLGDSPEQTLELLGERTFDIYLNEVAYWKNIPIKVWDYAIGGYQIIKKWLSYREADLLKRPLTTDEAREVRDMARRIAAIILFQPALDENYQQRKENVYDWPTQVVGV